MYHQSTFVVLKLLTKLVVETKLINLDVEAMLIKLVEESKLIKLAMEAYCTYLSKKNDKISSLIQITLPCIHHFEHDVYLQRIPPNSGRRLRQIDIVVPLHELGVGVVWH